MEGLRAGLLGPGAPSCTSSGLATSSVWGPCEAASAASARCRGSVTCRAAGHQLITGLWPHCKPHRALFVWGSAHGTSCIAHCRSGKMVCVVSACLLFNSTNMLNALTTRPVHGMVSRQHL